MKDTTLLVLAGLLGGFITGLLGVGGGIFYIAALSVICKRKGEDAKTVFPTSLAAVMPVSVITLFLYHSAGTLPAEKAVPFILPALIGGTAGAFLYGKLDIGILRRIFAAVVIYSGFSLLIH